MYAKLYENHWDHLLFGSSGIHRRLGKETLFKYIDSFGFGEKTGVDLNGESSGILFSLSKVGPVELATTAFGQGVSVTAIHLTV